MNPIKQQENINDERQFQMTREAKIDRAVYLIDDKTKTYRFLRRNPDWKKLDSQVNEANKQSIDGYARIFRNGKTRKFVRSEHP